MRGRRGGGAPLVDGLTDHIHDAAEGLLADRNADGLLGVDHPLPAHQALRGVHSDRAHGALAQVLRHLEHQPDVVVLHLKRVEDGGQVAALELDVHDGTDHLGDLAVDTARGLHQGRRCAGGNGGLRQGPGVTGGAGAETRGVVAGRMHIVGRRRAQCGAVRAGSRREGLF